MTEKTIIGIGNALMDIVVKLPNDDILYRNALPKGSMTLVDASVSESIRQQTEGMEKILTPGGSVANTIYGLACLGAGASFIGKVGDDELGRLYGNELTRFGARPQLFQSETTPTGVAMALVTPDSERTFGTYLGAAIELSASDLTPHLFAGHQIAYIEGYLVQNHDLVRQAAQLARETGLTIALDLASYNVVESNRAFLDGIVREYVDILFANEDEAKAFTGKEPREALTEMAGLCNMAVVKTGSRGSLVQRGTEVHEIGITGSHCIDTTGAGDLYASGFLYGLSRSLPLEICGKIGAITAGKVITVYGARMEPDLWDSIHREIAALIPS
ncbi:MAG TPA: adenosine kinase [Prolixibacteraceae bacterium]|nr:adenosine kinase [Prolixibacteraceae bacterium]